jgi:hypothetical protein
MGAEMGKGMSQPGVLLFGRRTYKALATGVIIARYQPA